MVKIAEHSAQIYGVRGLALSIPKVFSSDNGLEKGDPVEIFRDTIDGKDVLILIPKDKSKEPKQS